MPPKCTEKLRSGFTVPKFSQKSSDIRLVWHSHMPYNLCALLPCMSPFGLCILTLTHPTPTSTVSSFGFFKLSREASPTARILIRSEMIMNGDVFCGKAKQQQDFLLNAYNLSPKHYSASSRNYLGGASSKSTARKNNTYDLVINQ